MKEGTLLTIHGNKKNYRKILRNSNNKLCKLDEMNKYSETEELKTNTLRTAKYHLFVKEALNQ